MSAQLPSHFFVTGTDTGVGKTTVTQQLMRQRVALGQRVVGMKPVASGCETINDQWQNEDVAAMQAITNVVAPLDWVNPYRFDPPIAPHIAAAEVGVHIDIAVIVEAYQQLSRLADSVIVEGAGGLMVPLNAHHTLVDLIQALQLPTLMVVGMRLGCINHALLTQHVLQSHGLPLCGWVANQIDPQMRNFSENLATLTAHLGPPQWVMPYSAPSH